MVLWSYIFKKLEVHNMKNWISASNDTINLDPGLPMLNRLVYIKTLLGLCKNFDIHDHLNKKITLIFNVRYMLLKRLNLESSNVQIKACIWKPAVHFLSSGIRLVWINTLMGMQNNRLFYKWSFFSSRSNGTNWV